MGPLFAPAGGEGRVVIAEDHELVRSAVHELLSASGFSVVGEAGDGDTAVHLADELSPDVVLIDVHMPGTDGWDATVQIRDRCPDVQVVVLSSEGDPDALRRSARAGAAEHVVKGTPSSEVCDAVTRAIAIARHAGPSGPARG